MPIFASNFASNSLSGVATVIAGNVTINLTPAAFALEGDRTFVVKLRKGSSQAAVIATSPVVTIKDRTTFVSLTANTATVNEGNLVAFSLVTTNVINGATVYYSVLPATANVTADDFTGNTGSAVITNNAATFALKANADVSLSNEDGENFKVQLRTNSPTGNVVFATSNVTILDTYKTYNVFQFTESTNQVYDVLNTSNVTFTVGMTNIPNGTVIYYNTVGNVTSFYSNTGSFVMNGTSNTFTINNPQVPFISTGYYNVVLRDGSPNGSIVATSNNITVIDDALGVMSATGGVQSNISGYRVHTLTSNGTVSFNKSGTIEYLIVAGGGSFQTWGGGGAGGLLQGTTTAVSATNYSVTIGPASSTTAVNGSNTQAFGFTAVGGGAGMNDGVNGTVGQGANGGSGAGGGGDNGVNIGGYGYPGQGYPGGSGRPGAVPGTPGISKGGGGGGAGGAGSNAPLFTPAPGTGSGGNGIWSTITGSNVAYAGGGSAGYISTIAWGSTGYGAGSGWQGSAQPGIVIFRYGTNIATLVSLTTSSNFAYEGQNFAFTLNTSAVSNNTLLYYYTVGNVLTSDFVTGNTGSFTTTNDSTTITLTANSNIPINEERFFQLRIAGDTGTSASPLLTSNVFTIKDSNLKPNATAFQYLIVAGGGGSAGSLGSGGGGGGGGVLLGNANVTVGYTYVVAIGAGGSGSAGGGSSILINASNVVASGGGVGGGPIGGGPVFPGSPGGPGGSGGGGASNGGAPGPGGGGSGIPGQGFAGGGANKMIPGQQGAGGGGAGGVGQDATTPSTYMGAGGIGIYSTLSGTRTGYAGGGGGYPGGAGGAFGLSSPEWTSLTGPAFGAGGAASPAPFANYNQQTPGAAHLPNGVTNTGGGAAGGGAGAGGSGVAIVVTPDSVKTTTATTGSPNVIYANNNIIYRFWQSGTITF